MARPRVATVTLEYDGEFQRLISEQVRREMGALRDEIEEDAGIIPRTTLADLLGFDQAESTPTWGAIFQAVDELAEVRRG